MADDRSPTQATVTAVTPSPSADEAAAIVAALECFAAATMPAPGAGDGHTGDPWQRAALLEGIGRKAQPVAPSAWMA
jgi:hypothetical protein